MGTMNRDSIETTIGIHLRHCLLEAPIGNSLLCQGCPVSGLLQKNCKPSLVPIYKRALFGYEVIVAICRFTLTQTR